MANRGRPSKKASLFPSYLDKISGETKSSQSKLSMVLGALIVLVVGILIFNYFNKNNAGLGPAQQTQNTEDVSPENLPGKYTVKEDDTLFTIAEKYYKDGYKFTEIVKANKLANADAIETGQILEIPKVSGEAMAAETATGGGNTTVWGPKIDGDSYTVAEGDWLSTISARAYGDIYAYKKLAEANNIQNPDLIYPGQVLKIPR